MRPENKALDLISCGDLSAHPFMGPCESCLSKILSLVGPASLISHYASTLSSLAETKVDVDDLNNAVNRIP